MPSPPTPPTAPPTSRGVMPKGASVPTNRVAIWSLLCGFAGFVLPLVNITGIVLGAIAVSRLNRSKGAQQGYGYAIAGMALGLVGTLVNFFVTIMVVSMIFGVQQTLTQTVATKRGPNLSAIHGAFTQFADDTGRYPTHAAEIVAAGGAPMHTFVAESFLIEGPGKVVVGEYDFVNYVYTDEANQAVASAVEKLDATEPMYRFGKYDFVRLAAPTDDGTIIVAWSDPDEDGQRVILFDDGNWRYAVVENWAPLWADDATARKAVGLGGIDAPVWVVEEEEEEEEEATSH